MWPIIISSPRTGARARAPSRRTKIKNQVVGFAAWVIGTHCVRRGSLSRARSAYLPRVILDEAIFASDPLPLSAVRLPVCVDDCFAAALARTVHGSSAVRMASGGVCTHAPTTSAGGARAPRRHTRPVPAVRITRSCHGKEGGMECDRYRTLDGADREGTRGHRPEQCRQQVAAPATAIATIYDHRAGTPAAHTHCIDGCPSVRRKFAEFRVLFQIVCVYMCARVRVCVYTYLDRVECEI